MIPNVIMNIFFNNAGLADVLVPEHHYLILRFVSRRSDREVIHELLLRLRNWVLHIYYIIIVFVIIVKILV